MPPKPSPLNSVEAFLAECPQPCLGVFDARRGYKEGTEADKVLCFHPECASNHVRTSLVGLAQALTSFSASFGADESAEHVMEAKHHRWALVQCEPHIWMLMVAKKSWLGNSSCSLMLRSFLRMVHTQHVLLHGPITYALAQDPSGSSTRHALQPIVSEFGARLACQDSLEAAAFSNPLGLDCSHMPLLPTPTPALLSVQCLVSALARLLPATPSSSRPHHLSHQPPSHPSSAEDSSHPPLHSTPPTSPAPPHLTSPHPQHRPTSLATDTAAQHTPGSARSKAQSRTGSMPVHGAAGTPRQTSAGGAQPMQHAPPRPSFPVQGVMALWQGRPVWSTLNCQDSVSLHHFAQRALMPHVEGSKRSSKLQKALAAATAAECAASVRAAAAQHSSTPRGSHSGISSGGGGSGDAEANTGGDDTAGSHLSSDTTTPTTPTAVEQTGGDGAHEPAAAAAAQEGGARSPPASPAAVAGSSAAANTPASPKQPTTPPTTAAPTAAAAAAAARDSARTASPAAKLGGSLRPSPPLVACFDTLLSPNRWCAVGFGDACRAPSASAVHPAGTQGGGDDGVSEGVGVGSAEHAKNRQGAQGGGGKEDNSAHDSNGSGGGVGGREREQEEGGLNTGGQSAGEASMRAGSSSSSLSERAERAEGGVTHEQGGGSSASGSSWREMVASASTQASAALGTALSYALAGSTSGSSSSSSTQAAAPTAPASPAAAQQQLQQSRQTSAQAQKGKPTHEQEQQQQRQSRMSGFLVPLASSPPPLTPVPSQPSSSSSTSSPSAAASAGSRQAAARKTAAVGKTAAQAQSSSRPSPPLPPHALALDARHVPGLRSESHMVPPVGARGAHKGLEADSERAWGGLRAACVWVQGLQRPCVLLPAYHSHLLVLMLLCLDDEQPPTTHDQRLGQMGQSLPEHSTSVLIVPTEALRAIVEVLAEHVPLTSARLAACVPSQDLWHHPGYRYCHEDDTCAATRCTPAEKVSTLSSSTLRAAAHLRDRLSYWRDASEANTQASASNNHQVQGLSQGLGGGVGMSRDGEDQQDGCLQDFELLCRTGQGSWVGARRADPRQTLVALDHLPGGGQIASMQEAAAHMHKLYDAVAEGCYVGLG